MYLSRDACVSNFAYVTGRCAHSFVFCMCEIVFSFTSPARESHLFVDFSGPNSSWSLSATGFTNNLQNDNSLVSKKQNENELQKNLAGPQDVPRIRRNYIFPVRSFLAPTSAPKGAWREVADPNGPQNLPKMDSRIMRDQSQEAGNPMQLQRDMTHSVSTLDEKWWKFNRNLRLNVAAHSRLTRKSCAVPCCLGLLEAYHI